MIAMKTAALGFFIAAGALSGCTGKNPTAQTQNAPAASSGRSAEDNAKPVRFMTEPSAHMDEVLNEQGLARYTIILPAGKENETKSFTGQLGIYDQSTFEKGPGADPLSPEILYVASLDRNADTLIAIHYADGARDTGGTAFAFKRLNRDAPFRFSWMAFGQTSRSATDLDTYMTENEATIDEALRAQLNQAAAPTTEPADQLH